MGFPGKKELMYRWERALKKGVLPFLGVRAHWQMVRREIKGNILWLHPFSQPSPISGSGFAIKMANKALKGSFELRL